jgi:hypothetical protein
MLYGLDEDLDLLRQAKRPPSTEGGLFVTLTTPLCVFNEYAY